MLLKLIYSSQKFISVWDIHLFIYFHYVLRVILKYFAIPFSLFLSSDTSDFIISLFTRTASGAQAKLGRRI